MKFVAALIASLLCVGNVANAKVHKLGLKKIPKEDFSIVIWGLRVELMIGTYERGAFETEVYGIRSNG